MHRKPATRPPRVSVSFCLGGRGLDLERCTREIGVVPSRVWVQRQAGLRDRPDLNTEEWIVSHDDSDSHSVDHAVAALLDRIWPLRERVASCAQDMGAQASVTCNIHIYGDLYTDRPVYDLAVGTMRRLVELNADFALDIFLE